MGIKDVLLIMNEGLVPKVQKNFNQLSATFAKNIIGYAFTGNEDLKTRDILYIDSRIEYDENELRRNFILYGKRFADKFEDLIKKHRILQENSHYIIAEGNDLNPGWNTIDDFSLVRSSTCYMLTLAHRMLKKCGISRDEVMKGIKDVGWISESGESFRSGSLDSSDNMLMRMNELALERAYRLE